MVDWWLFFASNILVVTMAIHTYVGNKCELTKIESGGREAKQPHFTIPRLFFIKKQVNSDSRVGIATPEVLNPTQK